MRTQFAMWLFCLFSLSAFATVENDPYHLVQTVADKTLARIKSEHQQISENPERLKTLVKEELMPYVDYRLAGKIILERTQADEQTQSAFFHAFEAYLVTTYATIFGKYDDQTLEVEPAKTVEGKKVVGVKAKVIGKSKPEAQVEFKLRQNKQTGDWAVFDMVVEGVSLLNSKKAELKPILRQAGGIAEATRLLNEKAGSTIKLKEAS